MNIYSYFQNEAKDCPPVPTKNQALWKWSILQSKKAMLSKSQSYTCLSWANTQLQNDESFNEMAFKKTYLKKINHFSSHPIAKEFCDLPLVVLIFEVILNDFYNAFVKGAPFGTFSFSIGSLIRIAGIYILVKLILVFLAAEPKQSSLGFWIRLSILFFFYLLVQYIARNMETFVLFSIPMILWIGVVLLTWILSFRWFQKVNH